MSDMNKNFENLIKDFEQNLESNKDIEYVKNSLSSYFEEYNSNIEKRIKTLEESQKDIEFRTNKIETLLSKMEDELFIDEDEEEIFNFEIVCPYCNYVFEAELDELKEDITCPECKNVIELDWNCEDDECSGGCSCCHGCSEEEFEDEELDDDDM